MWFFLEFLPECFLLIRKVKNHLHNKYILISSILFICFILVIFNFFPQDFHYFIYALITIVYAITISIIIKNIENSQQNKEYQPMHFDVIFNKTTLIKNIKYKEIYDFSTLLPQNAPNTHISITILSAPISVEINHIKTRSKKISTIDSIFHQLIYTCIFTDHLNKNWQLTIQLKGIFHPKIIIQLFENSK